MSGDGKLSRSHAVTSAHRTAATVAGCQSVGIWVTDDIRPGHGIFTGDQSGSGWHVIHRHLPICSVFSLFGHSIRDRDAFSVE